MIHYLIRMKWIIRPAKGRSLSKIYLFGMLYLTGLIDVEEGRVTFKLYFAWKILLKEYIKIKQSLFALKEKYIK